MKKIKIGQIGVCYEHASGKINALRLLPDIFEIVGVIDDRESSKVAKFLPADLLKPYEGLKWMTEEELLNTPGFQAVTVETPNIDLVSVATHCMEHNLAMHMDKPGADQRQLCFTRHGRPGNGTSGTMQRHVSGPQRAPLRIRRRHCCSWPRTRRPSSPERNIWSTAAGLWDHAEYEPLNTPIYNLKLGAIR